MKTINAKTKFHLIPKNCNGMIVNGGDQGAGSGSGRGDVMMVSISDKITNGVWTQVGR